MILREPRRVHVAFRDAHVAAYQRAVMREVRVADEDALRGRGRAGRVLHESDAGERVGGARRTSPSMGTDGLVRDARTRSNPRGNAPSRAPTRRSMEIHRRVLGLARPRGVDFSSRRPRSRRLARATRARAAACAAAYARVVMTMRASASRARVSKSESCARSFASAADGSGVRGDRHRPRREAPQQRGEEVHPRRKHEERDEGFVDGDGARELRERVARVARLPTERRGVHATPLARPVVVFEAGEVEPTGVVSRPVLKTLEGMARR